MLDNSSIKGDRDYLVRHSINALFAQGKPINFILSGGVSLSAQGRENIGFSPLLLSIKMTLQVVT